MSTQTEILRIFEENRGQYISGEGIALSLGISRNAVWKSIKSLRAQGYAIESKTNMGYCLKIESDILSIASIGPFLRDPSLSAHLEVYPSLGSTNTFGKEKALGGAPDGTVILSETQTGGRGRMGRAFISPKGTGIYLSMILRPKTAIDQSLFITIAACVLIRRAIAKVTGIEAQIKWVNDLYIEDKKICGILTEAAADFETGTIDYVVLGAGINFVNPKEPLPESLKNIVGFLYESAPVGNLRSRLTAELINELSTLSKPINHSSIMAEYRAHSMVLGKPVTLSSAGKTIGGTVTDINEAGHLILKTIDGNTQTIVSGEVSLRLKK